MGEHPESDAAGEDASVLTEPSDIDGLEEVSLPEEEKDFDDEEPSSDVLSFCELCGASECDDDELLRCEECGRLHCSACREFDDEGSSYCSDCFDEIEQK